MSVPDYPLGQTLDFKFTTRGTDGVPATLSGTPAVEIYEDNSVTQITAAETLTVDFDSVTGLNNLRVVATSGNGFESGKSYHCVISAGTVGGTSVVGEVVQQFSIERSPALRPTTAGRTLDVTATGAAGIDWGNVENQSTAVDLSATDIQLVDTCTTNTDMRGTDSALLAASAPTNFGDLAITVTTGQVTVGTNNDKTGYSLSSTGMDSVTLPANIITASAIAADAIGASELAADAVTEIQSGLSTHSAADVWSVATRVLTANTNLNDPTAAAIADAVWDEVITGAFHNVQNSAAKFLREGAEANALLTGTAQSGGATTITLESGAVTANDILNGERIAILEGTGAGQSRLITDSAVTTDVVTVSHAWTTNPDNTSVYAVMGAESDVRAIAEQPVSATATVDFDDLATIEADTNELQGDWTNGGRLDLILDELTTQGDTNETLLNDIPTTSEFEARTLLASAYFDFTTDTVTTDAASRTASQADVSSLATASELAKVPKSDGTTAWNATAAAQIQSEANDALVAYDPPTRTEATSDKDAILTRLGTPAGADIAADIAENQTDLNTLLSRVTSTLFTGITSMAEWLGALAGKQTADATAQTEIRATGAGSGTYDATTDSQEAIRDNQGGGGGLSLSDTISDGQTAGTVGKALENALDYLDATISSVASNAGSGADTVTLNFKDENSNNIADADVWITSDQAGTVVVAGTLQTNSSGNVTFSLDAGSTYYAFLQKDGVNSIRARQFVAVAD